MVNYKALFKLVALIFLTYSDLTTAHVQTGSLGKKTTGAAATDTYYVTCRDEDLSGGYALTDHLVISVRDLAPVLAPLISIQISKNGISSTLSTDLKDGDAKYSPTVRLAGGAGTYLLTINKSGSTKKGIETYIAQFHCETATSSHTATAIQMIGING